MAQEQSGKSRLWSSASRPPECLTTGEAAKVAGVTLATVKRWIFSGRFQAARSPTGIFWIKESDLEEFLAQPAKFEFKLWTKPKKETVEVQKKSVKRSRRDG